MMFGKTNGASGMYALDEMDFFATCDALMLFGAEMCHLGSMPSLGNFGEF
jgi:hypothetical protein